ncbi:unnamed protein product, partial [Didymodactylos carnosus]
RFFRCCFVNDGRWDGGSMGIVRVVDVEDGRFDDGSMCMVRVVVDDVRCDDE